jgi:hypothetical protein
MKPSESVCQPIEGKTFSLFGNSGSTREYYNTIRSIAEELLSKQDPVPILATLIRYSHRKKLLKRLTSDKRSGHPIKRILDTVRRDLKPYTQNTKTHLDHLPLWKKLRDRRLGTSEEQYHLYMLEIELTNRLNRELFLQADRKISLQPYCLQDFSVSCKARNTGFDYQCSHCSATCFQNQASKILEKHQVEPFIWMEASLANVIRVSKARNQTLGILGIACIPELVLGMRQCRKYGIPVVGISLNANRCIRWFGRFYPNSVDVGELERLVNPSASLIRTP